MASLMSLYLKKDTLEVLKKGVKDGEKGIEITVSVNDSLNDYGQNVAAYVSQSKEERAAQKKRYYVGNGKVFWTDGTIKDFKSLEGSENQNNTVVDNSDDDLPF